MNKTYLCVLPLTLLLAAYSGQSVAGQPNRTTEPSTPPKCKGEPQAPMVTFNLKTMEAKPHCVRARPGTTILFRLTPKKDVKDAVVKVLPKESFDDWLQGNNDAFDDVIIIRVPGEYNPKSDPEYSDHYYIVEVGNKKIDPRVEVQR